MAGISTNNPAGGEYSFGKGQFVNPMSDFQTPRQGDLAIPKNELTNRKLYQDMVASKRLSPTVTDEAIEDMYFREGDADFFGPGPKLVREEAKRPEGPYPTVEIPGPNRQG